MTDITTTQPHFGNTEHSCVTDNQTCIQWDAANNQPVDVGGAGGAIWEQWKIDYSITEPAPYTGPETPTYD